MTQLELEKLSGIIDELWQLHQQTNDSVAQDEIRKARGLLLILWGAGERVQAERD